MCHCKYEFSYITYKEDHIYNIFLIVMSGEKTMFGRTPTVTRLKEHFIIQEC